MGKKTRTEKEFNLLESIITVAIILVIIHTFLEDFAVVVNWNKNIQSLLAIIGFFFDLLFTVEFLVRLYLAIHEKTAFRYFIYEKGWVDFLAAIPLLMFNSGPLFITVILGKSVASLFGGFLNMLKLIKAIRIARVLRLLRILKIFKQIKYIDSKMTQRHAAKIITITITTLVLTLFVMGTLSEALDFSGMQSERAVQRKYLFDIINSNKKFESGINAVLNAINELKAINNVLVIKKDGKTIYTRFSQKYYDSEVGYNDYDYSASENIEIFFDLRGINALQDKIHSKDSILFFFIVLILVIIYLVIYSPHFTLTITDPIYVMRRGFKEPGYNLKVKIPDNYKEDDIYRLAFLYNEIYLPLKKIDSQQKT